MSSNKSFNNKYDKWESVAKELVTQAEDEDEAEKKESSKYLGLDGKVPRSQAEADERAKMEAARLAKVALDKQKEMEEKKKIIIDGLDGEEEGTVVLDDARLQGRRVIVLRNCCGIEFHLVRPRSIHDSIIKVFIEGCTSCVVKVEVPIVTSMIEISHCKELRVEIKKYPVNTMQIDVSSKLHVEYMDENIFGNHMNGKNNGDRIYHAGVSDMILRVPISSEKESKTMERKIDYLADGAVRVSEESAEEYQFASFVNWEDGTASLVTEKVHRVGTRLFTQSELDKRKKENQEDTMVQMHSEDVKIRECENHKAEGNKEFGNGNYGQAVLFYSMAIDKSSNLVERTYDERNICFSNRSACFLKLGQHEKALEDAESCIQLTPDYVKGQFRKGLALHAMGKYSEALPVLAKAHKIEPKNKQIKQAIQFAEVKLQMEMRRRMST